MNRNQRQCSGEERQRTKAGIPHAKSDDAAAGSGDPEAKYLEVSQLLPVQPPLSRFLGLRCRALPLAVFAALPLGLVEDGRNVGVFGYGAGNMCRSWIAFTLFILFLLPIRFPWSRRPVTDGRLPRK